MEPNRLIGNQNLLIGDYVIAQKNIANNRHYESDWAVFVRNLSNDNNNQIKSCT